MANIPAPVVNAFNLQENDDVDEAMAAILQHSQLDWLSQAEMLAIYQQHEHFEMSDGKYGPAPPIQEGLYLYDAARFSDRYQWTQVPGARRRNCVSGPTVEGQQINFTEARMPVPNGSFRRRNHHHVDNDRLCLVHYQIRAPDGGPAVVADEDGDSESDESSEDDSESDDSSEEESEAEDSSDNDDPQEGEQVTVSGALALNLIEQVVYNERIRQDKGVLLSRFSAGNAPDISFDNSPTEELVRGSSDSVADDKLCVKPLKLVSGSCYLPHPDKEATGGEDAHFICAEEQALGVADGVGGWAELGIDAGYYSRELMSNSVNAIQDEPKGSIDPARVLEKAHTSTKSQGSSTACIIALTDQGLHAINLGDSGFMVVREGHTVFRSPVRQHDFNFTYQLESGSNGDLPSSGQVFTVAVAPRDVIIAGTDGLFDNLYNNEITAIVVQAVRAGTDPQVTAQTIAALARQRAQDKNRQTPFSTAAQDRIFDKVVYNERISQDKGVLLSRFSAGNTSDVSFDNSPTEELVRGSSDSVADDKLCVKPSEEGDVSKPSDKEEKAKKVKAWGEAALLLTVGAKGNHSALPSSTVMMKQVKLPSKHIGKSPEQIEADMKHHEYLEYC